MKRIENSFVPKILSVFLIVTFIISASSETVYAASETSTETGVIHTNASNTDDTLVVVSLGDSYSSGEGIEPFYNDLLPFEKKAKCDSWVAHRSQLSWPGQLKFSALENGKTLKDYNVDENLGTSKCKWYFRASSGAKTIDFFQKQIHTVNRPGYPKTDVSLDPQLDVFCEIHEDVDYVTLTIGGNDADFAKIIEKAYVEPSYLSGALTTSPEDGMIESISGVKLYHSLLEAKLEKTWAKVDTIKKDIKSTYEAIYNATNKKAHIIVAGYPQLLDRNGKGFNISLKEATLINEKVSMFNNEIKKVVKSCKDAGMKISFVSVEGAFQTHEAYSSDPWINQVWVIPRSQDINTLKLGSAYSIHPNAKGAQLGYAKCVNSEIEEIEGRGALSGKVCKASDRTTPIGNATILIGKQSDGVILPGTYLPSRIKKTDSNGNYSFSVPEGSYIVEISADGYVDFKSYATVTKDETTYMETFLMVQGSESDKGIAKGRVVNSLAGTGVEGVTLTFKPYWNNTSGTGDTVGTAVTDADGYYTAELPLGNYTAIATKNGFLESTFNIIVQEGTTDNQNGTITPIVSGDDFLITLTWGENPNDLDSHVIGTLSSGDQFHVYYWDKSQYDGDTEVCNLDYDDTTSYGPEHITLKPTSDKPYYYYIHHYAGSGTISTSNAKIQVHKGGVLIRQFNVPTSLGDGIYWNVFAIVNGEIKVKNTMTSSPDISYVNSDGTMVRGAFMLRGASTMTMLTPPDDITATVPKESSAKDETVSDDKDTTNNKKNRVESTVPVETESATPSENEDTVSSEETVSSENATVSSENTTSASQVAPKEESPASSSEDTASAASKAQNQAVAVPSQKEKADDVSPSDAKK